MEDITPETTIEQRARDLAKTIIKDNTWIKKTPHHNDDNLAILKFIILFPKFVYTLAEMLCNGFYQCQCSKCSLTCFRGMSVILATIENTRQPLTEDWAKHMAQQYKDVTLVNLVKDCVKTVCTMSNGVIVKRCDYPCTLRRYSSDPTTILENVILEELNYLMYWMVQASIAVNYNEVDFSGLVNTDGYIVSPAENDIVTCRELVSAIEEMAIKIKDSLTNDSD